MPSVNASAIMNAHNQHQNSLLMPQYAMLFSTTISMATEIRSFEL